MRSIRCCTKKHHVDESRWQISIAGSRLASFQQHIHIEYFVHSIGDVLKFLFFFVLWSEVYCICTDVHLTFNSHFIPHENGLFSWINKYINIFTVKIFLLLPPATHNTSRSHQVMFRMECLVIFVFFLDLKFYYYY